MLRNVYLFQPSSFFLFWDETWHFKRLIRLCCAGVSAYPRWPPSPLEACGLWTETQTTSLARTPAGKPVVRSALWAPTIPGLAGGEEPWGGHAPLPLDATRADSPCRLSGPPRQATRPSCCCCCCPSCFWCWPPPDSQVGESHLQGTGLPGGAWKGSHWAPGCWILAGAAGPGVALLSAPKLVPGDWWSQWRGEAGSKTLAGPRSEFGKATSAPKG